jgi:hypothetical protein
MVGTKEASSVAVAVAGVKRLDGDRDQEIALSGAANSLTAGRVADAIDLMQRVRHVIGERGLFENPLAVGQDPHRKRAGEQGSPEKSVHDLNSRYDTTAFQAVNFKLVLFYTSITRLSVTVKLSPADPDGLRRTLQTANAACDWISEQAWHHKTFRQLALHKLVYYQVRQRFGLSAQMAVRAIGKVVDAYALDKRTQRMFRTDGAFPYDARILSWVWNPRPSRCGLWLAGAGCRSSAGTAAQAVGAATG